MMTSKQAKQEYTLSRNEKEKVQKFVNEHLKKRYIRPSKLPQTSLVLFIGKKDGGKYMVMDYCRLNRQIVKNNYPLPLITDLVDSMYHKRSLTEFVIEEFWILKQGRISNKRCC